MPRVSKITSRKRKAKAAASTRPATLEQCWALIEALDKRIVRMHAVDRGVLSAAHLKELDAQNELLEAEGEETLCVAEYLACRLEDAEEAVNRVRQKARELTEEGDSAFRGHLFSKADGCHSLARTLHKLLEP